MFVHLFFLIARYINWLIIEESILDPNDECSSDCTILQPQPGTAASLVSVNAAAWPWMNQLEDLDVWKMGGFHTPNGRFNRENEHEGRSHQELWLFCPIFRQSYLGMLHGNSGLRLENPMGSTSLMFEHLDYGFPFTREIASQSAMDISASHLIAKHLQAHLSV